MCEKRNDLTKNNFFMRINRRNNPLTVKKLLICVLLASGLVSYAGCSERNTKTECRIHGIVTDKSKEGKKIFLVPLTGLQDAAHVDSTVISGGKFEFTADTAEMKVIRLDYHFRDNVQELLVVSEPGDVYVTIGSNSTTSGTPQNDSLQVWKNHIMAFSARFNALRQSARGGAIPDTLMTKLKAVQKEQLDYTHHMRDNMKKGVFYNFLKAGY